MVDVARTRRASVGARAGSPFEEGSVEDYARGAIEGMKRLARDEPLAFGLWALGLGFLLGWMLKPR